MGTTYHITIKCLDGFVVFHREATTKREVRKIIREYKRDYTVDNYIIEKRVAV